MSRPAGRAVVVEAVRTPIGRRGGALSGLKAVELLRHVQREVIQRAGIGPADVEQVIGGCVTQVGEQSLNVTRNAWLSLGFPPETGCTTVDVSCGSSQQANHVVSALIDAGVIEIGLACGVESMTRVPQGTNLTAVDGHYKTADYPWDDPPKAQFGGAERIAAREALTRGDLDAYGLRSQQRAAAAWAAGHYKHEVVAAPAPAVRAGSPDSSGRPDSTGSPGAEPVPLTEDEGLRASTAAGLAALAPTIAGGLHTAATTSQVSDGAAAVLWMSAERAAALGLTPRARLLDQVVTGADPSYLLDGPVAATRRILDRTGLRLDDIDRYEVNEAFAAVVLNWAKALDADEERLNVNGGSIALGHPMGATGSRLLVSALHELERTGGEFALVTMCCGGSLGTASVLQRV